jgi:diguanylate cyclase (GGDEF)-like protein/PAS domain S-box-containing protein
LALPGHGPLSGTYDTTFVVLSICIASIAAFVALTLTERITQSRGGSRLIWLGGGATVMGIGFWVIHFTGMLAFSLPVTVMYDLPTMAISLLMGIGASMVALLTVSRTTMNRGSWLAGAVGMGSGVAGMHYTGMAAMRMSARIVWNYPIIALTIVLAFAVSLVALTFAYRLRTEALTAFPWQRVPAAGLMGFAVAAVHYMGMAAGTFVAAPDLTPHGTLVGATSLVAGLIALSGIAALAFVLISAFIHRQISARDRAFDQHQRYFRTVIANAPVVLIALDANGIVVVAEGRDLAGLGYSAKAMVGRSFYTLYEHVPTLVEHARRALGGEEHAADATIAETVLETRWTPLKNEAGTVTSVIAVATDITERRAAELALWHRSFHDALTDLPNRTSLNEELTALLATSADAGRSVALVFMDLDRFKEVNDTLGHDIGDGLLQSVARRIDTCLVEIGITNGAMRLGGDEFAMILPGMDVTRASSVVRHVQREIATPHTIGEYTLDVAASCGIAIFPDHATDAQKLLRCADVAMYVAKRRGLGSTVYDPAQDRHSKARLALEVDMRQTIAQGGFELYYQPQVDVVTGRIDAVEALIRWPHATLGLLMPDSFIPLAEETGLIVPLTHWVIEEALRQVSRWSDEGVKLSVAVNISMRSIRQAGLPATIVRLMSNYAVDPKSLVIEVTESVVMADDEQTRDVFLALARLGIVLSIDDFGTGYSSLAYLRQLPVAELKIDKSFVLALNEGDPKAGELVRLITDLGHNLGLRVVAEGVESADVLDMLAGYGCDVAQGYFISRPIPAPALRRLLTTSWHTDGADLGSLSSPVVRVGESAIEPA